MKEKVIVSFLIAIISTVNISDARDSFIKKTVEVKLPLTPELNTDVQPKCIRLLWAKKKFDSTSGSIAEADKNKLRKWVLRNDQIISIFKYRKIVSGTEIDVNFEVLPYCYFGKIVIDGELMDFKVNAGGFAVTFSKSRPTLYYVVPGKMYPYFLSKPDSASVDSQKP